MKNKVKIKKTKKLRSWYKQGYSKRYEEGIQVNCKEIVKKVIK